MSRIYCDIQLIQPPGSAPSSFSKALVVVLACRARSTAAPKAPKVMPIAADPPEGNNRDISSASAFYAAIKIISV